MSARMALAYAPRVGMRGTTSGYEATITEVCEWSRTPTGVMVVLQLARGSVCVSARDFIPEQEVGA